MARLEGSNRVDCGLVEQKELGGAAEFAKRTDGVDKRPACRIKLGGQWGSVDDGHPNTWFNHTVAL